MVEVGDKLVSSGFVRKSTLFIDNNVPHFTNNNSCMCGFKTYAIQE